MVLRSFLIIPEQHNLGGHFTTIVHIKPFVDRNILCQHKLVFMCDMKIFMEILGILSSFVCSFRVRLHKKLNSFS